MSVTLETVNVSPWRGLAVGKEWRPRKNLRLLYENLLQ